MEYRPTGNNGSTGSSVEKALDILLAFSIDSPELGTTEISNRTGLPKSTASRLIHILVALSFLRKNPATKKYLLGSAAYKLGDAALRSRDIRLLTLAQPLLQELAQKTGESVALETLSGIDVVLAMHVEGPSHLRFNFQQGELVPIHVAAGAKVILSLQDKDFIEACIQREFVRFNNSTITSKQEYLKLLDRVRHEGIAYDRGERYHDIYAMAVPIIHPDGPPTAAVIIAGPASRLTEQFLTAVRPALEQTATQIGKGLYSKGEF